MCKVQTVNSIKTNSHGTKLSLPLRFPSFGRDSLYILYVCGMLIGENSYVAPLGQSVGHCGQKPHKQ